MLNLNDENIHENLFEISEGMTAAASFNVIEDDDIELDVNQI